MVDGIDLLLLFRRGCRQGRGRLLGTTRRRRCAARRVIGGVLGVQLTGPVIACVLVHVGLLVHVDRKPRCTCLHGDGRHGASDTANNGKALDIARRGVHHASGEDASAPRSTATASRRVITKLIDHRHREREWREEFVEGLLDEPIQQLAIVVDETRFRAVLRDES